MEIEAVLVNLLDGVNNVIHIRTLGQQVPVLEPDGSLTGALRIGTKSFA
jgi:hypothetical protein